MAQGHGYIYMLKRFFFMLYKKVFDSTFTENAIQWVFAKPGIWPVFRDDMMKTIQYPKVPKQRP
jgi:hypothetical protein